MRYKLSIIFCLMAVLGAVFGLVYYEQSAASPDEYTYYFDGYGTNDWDNSGLMTDGSTETHAWTYGNGFTQLLTSNTCPGTDLGTILKVELRVHGAAEDGVEEDDDIILRPVFAGGDGDDHQVDMPDFTTGKGWSVWVDITNDANAPVSWIWTDVQSLDCDVVHQQVNGLDYMLASKVTIRVTCGTLATYIITATAGTGGTITPSGTVTVTEGGSQTFSIVPDGDNSVADVLIDGVSMGPAYFYTFNNVTSNRYIEAIFNLSAECSDLSSVPLSAVKHAAPPNIMFVLDDSGSMDWEFLTEEWNGLFGGFRYVFDDPGDNVFSSPSYILSEKHRKKWKSQWSGYNRLYYDPGVDYEAWPTLGNADLDTPPSHPMNGNPTFALNDTYYLFDFSIIVDNLDGAPSYEETGFWDESMYEPEYNGSARYTDEVGATATFRPDLLVADTYEVYAWWNCWTGRDTNAKITVAYDGGTDIIYRNQRADVDDVPLCPNPGDPTSPCCGQWILIGSYPFRAGASGNVTIERHAGSDGSSTIADAVKFVPTTRSPIDVKNAHYYAFEDTDTDGQYDTGEPLYLVLIQGTGGAYTIRYFEATVTGGGATEQVTDLVEVSAASVPDSVKSSRSAAEERQNFANWYSYYRRRELTATAAVANAIVNMEAVSVGMYSINKSLMQPVLSVKARGEDQTSTLLDSLYNLAIVYDTITPLRQGLEAVGRYFDQDDNIKLDGTAGNDSPYADYDEGGACQQAFAIVMTDGYWNGDPPLNSDIANEDLDNGPPYEDDFSDTLADVAMYYYENDLSTGLEDDVPTNASDTATHQHMVTYTVAFGVSGTLNPAGYDLESGPYPTWPDPTAGNAQKIDDLWHAAVNGRGKFLSAFNSGELVDSLLAIKQNIESRTGSAASVSVNGVELYEEVGPELFMFQSTYDSNGWTGDVKAYPVNLTTGEVSDTPEWSAANKLDAMWWTNRKIATYNGAEGKPFVWDNLTLEQRQQLDPDEATAENIRKFLRGDRFLEGGTFRNRFSVLGDVVHSSPVYENGVLYTGANDGMLHAFRATDGSEIFAYIPNLIFENLKNLADPTYHGNHTYYVDLSPVIQPGVDQGGSTMTLLVGGLGKGGKGYYALDITGIDASTSFVSDGNVADRVLWEYGNDDDLGYSFTRPAIVDSNDDDLNANGTGWIVIVGNGYNSVNGKAVLLILDPSDGTVLKSIDTGVGSCNGLSTPVAIDVDYDDRVDYVYAGDLRGNLWKFDLTNPDYTQWGVAYEDGVGNPQPLFQALGQPITTKPDVMRHPERHGYIVVFGTGTYLGVTDFSDVSLNTIYGIWDYGDDADDSEYLGFFNRGSPTNKLSNQPENVTLLEQEFVPSPGTDPNSPFFWTVTVNGEELKLRILTRNPPETDGKPNWETVDDTDTDELPNPGSVAEPPNTVHAGWYFDLPLTGERVVTDVMIRDAKAIVITFTPEEAPCSIGGDSIVHEMDAASGGRLLRAQFDIGGAAAIDSEDLINIGTEASPVWVAPTGIQKTGRLHLPAILRMGSTEMKYFSSSEGTIKRVREKPPKVGVRYWRELE